MAKERDDSEDFDPQDLAYRKELDEQFKRKQEVINTVTIADVEEFRRNPTLDHYQHLATRFAFYPGQGFPLGLLYVVLKLNGEAGEAAEHVGKAMRDDGYGMMGSRLTPERKRLLVKELGDIAWYLVAACRELNVLPSEVLEENLVKLADRAARNVQSGSGDNR